MDTHPHPTTSPALPDQAWDILLMEVRAMLEFHTTMDGDDRLDFATSLRMLAAREERAGICQRRFGRHMLAAPTAAIH